MEKYYSSFFIYFFYFCIFWSVMTMNFQKRKLGFLRRNLFLPVNRDKANILFCLKKNRKNL